MKKLVFALILVFAAGMVFANDIASPEKVTYTVGEKTIIVYDPVKHTETASNVFMLWGGLSTAAGIPTMFSRDTVTRSVGIGMLTYGVVETAMAIYNINWGTKITDPEKARTAMIEKSGLSSILGLVQFAGGGLIAIFGSDDLKGYGIAMAIQGGFFSINDGLNYFISKDPGTVRDWQTDTTYRVRLASMDFYGK